MKFLVMGILALAVLNPWAATVQASSGSSAPLQVRATIRPWIKFAATPRVASYLVTEEDIRRGFIDLPGALTLNVQTNIGEAIRFDISSNGPERILAHEGGSALTDTVRIKGQYPAIPIGRLLDMRVVLPEGTQEGTYPFQVAVEPVAY